MEFLKSIDPMSLIMIVGMVVILFFMFRNGKKNKERAEKMRESVRPGAEVMLSAGIYGTVVAVTEGENARVTLRSGETTLDVHPQAVVQVINESVEEPDNEAEVENKEKYVSTDSEPDFGERA